MNFKVILVGQSISGKRLMLNWLFGNPSDTDQPTVTPAYNTKEIKIDSHIVNLQIWDTVGSDRFMSIGQMFYRESHLALIVYSISDRSSFEKVDHYNIAIKENSSPNTIIF